VKAAAAAVGVANEHVFLPATAPSGVGIVIAGADCGFSSQAMYNTEVHHTVVWEKFKAMRQGAGLATDRLWGKRRAA
jgi:hypothetical protein